jgi:hypothetical protein
MAGRIRAVRLIDRNATDKSRGDDASALFSFGLRWGRTTIKKIGSHVEQLSFFF